MKTLIVSLLISSQVLAQETQFITKGTPAPNDGFLTTREKMQQIQKELVQKDYLVEDNKSLNKSIDLYKLNEEYKDNQIALLQHQNDRLSSSLEHSEWTKVIYFTLGVAATGLAVYGASQIINR